MLTEKEQIVFVGNLLFCKIMYPLVLYVNFFFQINEALVNLEALNSPPAHLGLLGSSEMFAAVPNLYSQKPMSWK